MAGEYVMHDGMEDARRQDTRKELTMANRGLCLLAATDEAFLVAWRRLGGGTRSTACGWKQQPRE